MHYTATGNLNLNREDFRLPTVEPIFFLINIFNQDPLSSSVYRLCRFSVAVTVRLELDARETRCTHILDRKPGYVERYIKKRVRDRKRDLINARGKLYVWWRNLLCQLSPSPRSRFAERCSEGGEEARLKVVPLKRSRLFTRFISLSCGLRTRESSRF